jgi:hypothetical protein
MREVAELREAGKIREARQAMQKTEEAHRRLKALESKMRPVGPGD